MGWTLLALVGADRLEIHALASSIARVYEDYPVESLVVASSERVWSREKLEETSQTILRELGISLQARAVTLSSWLVRREGRETTASEEIREILRSTAAKGCTVVTATPASRRLAMEAGIAVGRAIAQGLCVEAVFLDFLWGQWRGLPYPYVPRVVEPLTAIPPRYRPPDWHGRSTAEKAPSLTSRGCRSRVAGELPPLRCLVAELARRINAATGPGPLVAEDTGEKWPENSCGRLEIVVTLDGWSTRIEIRDACSPSDWQESARDLRRILHEIAASFSRGGWSPLDQLPAFTGLRHVTVDGRRPYKLTAPLVADTSLIYTGLHNEALLGACIVLPYCAVLEVTRRYAEHSKKRSEPAEALMDALAYAAISELKAAGVSLAPSPRDMCDTAIPAMDPLLLDGTIVATRDTGAYQLWSQHPATAGIAQPVRATVVATASEEPGEPVYAIAQTLVALKTLERLLHNERLKIMLVAERDSKRTTVNIPALNSSTQQP